MLMILHGMQHQNIKKLRKNICYICGKNNQGWKQRSLILVNSMGPTILDDANCIGSSRFGWYTLKGEATLPPTMSSKK